MIWVELCHSPSVFVRVLRRNSIRRISVEREREKEKERGIYYQELAFTVLEAEKPHDLPSANWRPRKAVGVGSSLSLKI